MEQLSSRLATTSAVVDAVAWKATLFDSRAAKFGKSNIVEILPV